MSRESSRLCDWLWTKLKGSLLPKIGLTPSSSFLPFWADKCKTRHTSRSCAQRRVFSFAFMKLQRTSLTPSGEKSAHPSLQSTHQRFCASVWLREVGLWGLSLKLYPSSSLSRRRRHSWKFNSPSLFHPQSITGECSVDLFPFYVSRRDFESTQPLAFLTALLLDSLPRSLE